MFTAMAANLILENKLDVYSITVHAYIETLSKTNFWKGSTRLGVVCFSLEDRKVQRINLNFSVFLKVLAPR